MTSPFSLIFALFPIFLADIFCRFPSTASEGKSAQVQEFSGLSPLPDHR
jgi:hypothetical protein